MKQEILERLEIEVNACKRYAENSVKKQKSKSWISHKLCRYSCNSKKSADRLHDEFWEILDGKLTEEEFKIFCKAEILNQEINKVYIELKLERK